MAGVSLCIWAAAATADIPASTVLDRLELLEQRLSSEVRHFEERNRKLAERMQSRCRVEQGSKPSPTPSSMYPSATILAMSAATADLI